MFRILVGLALSAGLFGAAQAAAEGCCDPASPFRPGEALVDDPATCETAGEWLAKAPDIDARVTMTVKGRLSSVDTDGTLAYLVMCERPGVRILCVTYGAGGHEPGDAVVIGGGFNRGGEDRIILDPCLASPQ